MKKDELLLQIDCYTWFHNTHVKHRGELTHMFSNPKDERQGAELKRAALQPGYPDIVFFRPKRPYFAELKTPIGSLSPIQKERIKQLTNNNYPVDIIRTLQEFKDWVADILLY